MIHSFQDIFPLFLLLMKNGYEGKSYTFYLEMNPEEIRSIFEHEKKISSKENEPTNWKEPFLRKLIAYYVAFAG